jgi:hypothetical protein
MESLIAIKNRWEKCGGYKKLFRNLHIMKFHIMKFEITTKVVPEIVYLVLVHFLR